MIGLNVSYGHVTITLFTTDCGVILMASLFTG